MRATSEPIRELAIRDPLIEKASSSSAEAFTLALSSGRSDSFSSSANVVPDVILFPSRLGALAPISELESALCEASSDVDAALSFLLCESPIEGEEPFTTRLGVDEALAAESEVFTSFPPGVGLEVLTASLLGRVVATPFSLRTGGGLAVVAGVFVEVAIVTLLAATGFAGGAEDCTRCSMAGTATRGVETTGIFSLGLDATTLANDNFLGPAVVAGAVAIVFTSRAHRQAR